MGKEISAHFIYGGSFDPVHCGHILTAVNIQKMFSFERFAFLPCKTPVLKYSTEASPQDRVSMLELALANYPTFSLDLREIKRETPSFMVETLKDYRIEYGNKIPIILILGTDAFINLHRWHEWKKISSLCHLLIIKRPQWQLDLNLQLKEYLLEHQTLNKDELSIQSGGKIFLFDAGTFDISSSWLREQIKRGAELSEYLPLSVIEYINRLGLYQ